VFRTTIIRAFSAVEIQARVLFENNRRPTNTDHQHTILFTQYLIIYIHAYYGIGSKLLSRLRNLLKG
jgi:hypothetical protein